jgi:acetolactate synthase-1/3 small subunit
VRCDAGNRSHIIEIVDIFRANIIDVSPESVIVEVTGDEGKIDAMFELLKDYGVIEMVRTGRVAMLRGAAASHPVAQEEPYERYPGQETW